MPVLFVDYLFPTTYCKYNCDLSHTYCLVAFSQFKATMAETMKGVIIEGVGAPYKVVEDLKVPEPGEGQVLVKSIATAINPV